MGRLAPDSQKAASAPARATKAATGAERPKRRMSAEDREEQIVRIATSYFADNGLSAGTIDLARRIGITQPLLYQYFPTKEALIDRVYERLFPKNWDDRWEKLLDDDSIPVRDRLKTFYTEYAGQVLTYDHVRLFLFSGLSNNVYNARFYSILTERLLTRIAKALRRAFGDDRNRGPVNDEELELVQSLHAAVYHVMFRRWVHSEPLKADLADIISGKVDICLDGAERAFRWIRQPRTRARKPAAGASVTPGGSPTARDTEITD